MWWKKISRNILDKFNISNDYEKATDISNSVDQLHTVGRSSFINIERNVNNKIEDQFCDENTTSEEVAETSIANLHGNGNLETSPNEVVISENGENVVDYGDDIKRDQMLRVDELIETEKTYVNQLQRVIRYYIPSLKAEWGVPRALTLLQPKDIFCNIKEIYKFHKKILLPALIEARHDVKAIGNVFIQNTDSLLVLYEIYFKEKRKCDRAIKKHSHFFEQKQEEFYDDCDISSHINTPFQRITRYPIFLESMVKNCQKLNNRTIVKGKTSNCRKISISNDYQILQDALQSILDVLEMINTKSILFGLKDLQVISKLQGTYLRHNVFKVIDYSKNNQRLMTCFLFEKCFLLAIKLNQKISADEMYKHYVTIPIKYLGFITPVDEKTNHLTIWYHGSILKQYVLEVETSIRYNWIRDINRVMCQQLNNDLYRDLFEHFRIFYNIGRHATAPASN